MINFIKCFGFIQGTQVDVDTTINKAGNDLSNSIHGLRATDAFFKTKLIIITA